jgi:5'-nucleotidase
MKLLISNDDGIFAHGIRALANTMAEAGHTVTVICPDRERSATGHGLTLHEPIRADRVESVFQPDVRAWACSGTPADCVKLGLGALLEEPPDLVLSGINHGANLGTDVLYSGTVSAAMEGTIEGISSIAFSLTSYTGKDFRPAAQIARLLVANIIENPPAHPVLLNVNIPPLKLEEIKGIVMTRQGIRRYIDLFQKRLDPRGKTYYWLAGEAIEDIVEEGTIVNHPYPTDVETVQRCCVAITPLHYNLTCYRTLDTWQSTIDNADLFSLL